MPNKMLLSICQGQIQLKVKCQGHFKVKYLKLFLITNFAMTPYCEVFTMVKVKCQGQIPQNVHNE